MSISKSSVVSAVRRLIPSAKTHVDNSIPPTRGWFTSSRRFIPVTTDHDRVAEENKLSSHHTGVAESMTEAIDHGHLSISADLMPRYKTMGIQYGEHNKPGQISEYLNRVVPPAPGTKLYLTQHTKGRWVSTDQSFPDYESARKYAEARNL